MNIPFCVIILVNNILVSYVLYIQWYLNHTSSLSLACVASVSVGFRGKELLREKREGRGRGRKEMLADKPLDFENHPLCLSCLTDFMLSWSIQVAFVILVLARFEILDHCIFLSNKNHTRLPRCQRFFFVFSWQSYDRERQSHSSKPARLDTV